VHGQTYLRRFDTSNTQIRHGPKIPQWVKHMCVCVWSGEARRCGMATEATMLNVITSSFTVELEATPGPERSTPNLAGNVISNLARPQGPHGPPAPKNNSD